MASINFTANAGPTKKEIDSLIAKLRQLKNQVNQLKNSNFTIKGFGKTAREIDQVSREIKRFGNTGSADLFRVSKSAKDLNKELQKIGTTKLDNSSVSGIREGLAQAQTMARRASGSIDRYNEKARKAVVNTVTFARELQSLASLAITFAAVGSIQNFIESIGRASDNLTRFKEGLKLVNTEAGAFDKVSEGLSNVANQYGVDINSLRDSYIRLGLTFKKSGATISENLSNMTKLAKAFRGAGIDSDAQGRALKAIEQMLSKGTIQAEELKQQLGDALPNVVQILANEVGVSVGTLFSMMKKGLLDSATYVPKLITGLEKVFGPAAQKNAESLGAEIIRTKNAIVEFQQAILQVNPDIFKKTLKAFQDLVKNASFQDLFANLGGGLDSFVSKLITGVNQISTALDVIVSGLAKLNERFHISTILGPLAQLVITLGLVAAGVFALRFAFSFLLGPLKNFGISLLAIIGFLTKFGSNAAKLGKTIESLAAAFNRLGLTRILVHLRNLGINLLKARGASSNALRGFLALSQTLIKLSKGFQVLGKVVGTIFKGVTAPVKIFFAALGAGIAIITAVGSKILNFKSHLSAVSSVLKFLIDGIKNFSSSFKALQSISASTGASFTKFGKIIETIKNAFKAFTSEGKSAGAILRSLTGSNVNYEAFSALSRQFKQLSEIVPKFTKSIGLSRQELRIFAQSSTGILESLTRLEKALNEVNSGRPFLRLSQDTRNLVKAFDGIDNFKNIVSPLIRAFQEFKLNLNGVSNAGRNAFGTMKQLFTLSKAYLGVLKKTGQGSAQFADEIRSLTRFLEGYRTALKSIVDIGKGAKLGLFTSQDAVLAERAAQAFKNFTSVATNSKSSIGQINIALQKFRRSLDALRAGGAGAIRLFDDKFITNANKLEIIAVRLAEIRRLSNTIGLGAKELPIVNAFKELFKNIEQSSDAAKALGTTISSKIQGPLTRVTNLMKQFKTATVSASGVNSFSRIASDLARLENTLTSVTRSLDRFNNSLAQIARQNSAIGKISASIRSFAQSGLAKASASAQTFRSALAKIAAIASRLKNIKINIGGANSSKVTGDIAKSVEELAQSLKTLKTAQEGVKNSSIAGRLSQMGSAVSKFVKGLKLGDTAAGKFIKTIGKWLGPIAVVIDAFNEWISSGNILRTVIAAIVSALLIFIGVMAAAAGGIIGITVAIAALIAGFKVKEITNFFAKIIEGAKKMASSFGKAVGLIKTDAEKLNESIKKLADNTSKSADVFLKNTEVIRKGADGYRDVDKEIEKLNTTIKNQQQKLIDAKRVYEAYKDTINSQIESLQKNKRTLGGYNRSLSNTNRHLSSQARQFKKIKGASDGFRASIDSNKDAMARNREESARINEQIAQLRSKLKRAGTAYKTVTEDIKGNIKANEEMVKAIEKQGTLYSKAEQALIGLAKAQGKSKSEAEALARVQAAGLQTSREVARAAELEAIALEKKLAALRRTQAIERVIAANRIKNLAAARADEATILNAIQNEKNLEEARKKQLEALVQQVAQMEIRAGRLRQASELLQQLGIKEENVNEILKKSNQELAEYADETLKAADALLKQNNQLKAASEAEKLRATDAKNASDTVVNAYSKEIERLKELIKAKNTTGESTKKLTEKLNDLEEKLRKSNEKVLESKTGVEKLGESTKKANESFQGFLNFFKKLIGINPAKAAEGIKKVASAVGQLNNNAPSRQTLLAYGSMADVLSKLANSKSSGDVGFFDKITNSLKRFFGLDTNKGKQVATTVKDLNSNLNKIGASKSGSTAGKELKEASKGIKSISKASKEVKGYDTKGVDELIRKLKEMRKEAPKIKKAGKDLGEAITTVKYGIRGIERIGGNNERLIQTGKAIQKVAYGVKTLQRVSSDDRDMLNYTKRVAKALDALGKSGRKVGPETAQSIRRARRVLKYFSETPVNKQNMEDLRKIGIDLPYVVRNLNRAGSMAKLEKAARFKNYLHRVGQAVKKFPRHLANKKLTIGPTTFLFGSNPERNLALYRKYRKEVARTKHTKLVKTSDGYKLVAVGLGKLNRAARRSKRLRNPVKNIRTSKIRRVGRALNNLSNDLSGLPQNFNNLKNSTNNVDSKVGKLKPSFDKAKGGASGARSAINNAASAMSNTTSAASSAASSVRDLAAAYRELSAAKSKANSSGGGGGGSTSAKSAAIGGISHLNDSPRVNVPTEIFKNAPQFAQGTPNTGNFNGGIPAILHANEAVVPLSGGRKIPVQLKGDTEHKTVVHNTNYYISAEDVDSFNRSREQIEAGKFSSLQNSYFSVNS